MANGKKRKHRNLERSLPVMRPNAGGIDIGAAEIVVAVPADRDGETVRSFPTFTQDLHTLADWLQQCRIDTVAMESTGVYWIPLFQILEARGIEVHLVNAQHVHHVPGRKSDVLDCQWLQYLHSGRPVASVVSSRTGDLRDSFIDAASRKLGSNSMCARATYAEIIGSDESSDSSRH
jgi:hypothetical protein